MVGRSGCLFLICPEPYVRAFLCLGARVFHSPPFTLGFPFSSSSPEAFSFPFLIFLFWGDRNISGRSEESSFHPLAFPRLLPSPTFPSSSFFFPNRGDPPDLKHPQKS